jgi:DegV family protein with EDD domain
MGKIRFVTDSTADIPADLRASLGIEMVPLKVHFGKETFRDGVTIQSEQFYKMLAESTVMPTTSQPSPVDFLEIYKQLNTESNVQIISIHLGSALSGTYQSAVLAKSLLNENADITTVDSRTVSYGLGLLVVAAARAAQAGKSKEECLDLIYRLREQLKLYFLVDTLEFLQKGGRIGKASTIIGSMLNIKPILSIDPEGEVFSVDKVRGQKKAMQRIIELLQQNIMASQRVQVIIAHSNVPDTAEQFTQLLQANFQIDSIIYTALGPVIGTHAGPGAIGVFMLPV